MIGHFTDQLLEVHHDTLAVVNSWTAVHQPEKKITHLMFFFCISQIFTCCLLMS